MRSRSPAVSVTTSPCPFMVRIRRSTSWSVSGWSCCIRPSSMGANLLRSGAQQRTCDDQALDLARALVDLGDLGVAVVALGREVLRVAVAAEDLDRLAGPVAGDAAGEELGLRALDRVGPAGVLQAGCAQDQRARRFDLRLHLGEPVADRLEAADRAPERRALLGVARRHVERRLGDADRLRGDPDPAAVERRERDAHAGAWRPEALGRRLIEREVGRRGRVLAELLLLARHGEARSTA